MATILCTIPCCLKYWQWLWEALLCSAVLLLMTLLFSCSVTQLGATDVFMYYTACCNLIGAQQIVCTKLPHSGTRARYWYADAAVQQLHATKSLSRCDKMHLCSNRNCITLQKISMNATAFFISHDQVANFSLSKMLIDKKKKPTCLCYFFCFTVCEKKWLHKNILYKKIN